MEEFQKTIIQLLKANLDQQQKFKKDRKNWLWSYINNN